MGAFTDMLLPDKGSGERGEKVEQNDEGDPLPGTARHREFYPEGVAEILQVSSFQTLLFISNHFSHHLNCCLRKVVIFQFIGLEGILSLLLV